MKTSASSERRQSPRVGLVKCVALRFEDGHRVEARLLDLGEGGLRGVAALDELLLGAPLTVEMRIPGWLFSRRLQIPGTLVRVAAPSAQGDCEFAVELRVAQVPVRKWFGDFLRRALRAQQKLGQAQGAASPLADALRLVSLSLAAPALDRARVVLVTSAGAGEGKSFTAVHLAGLLASEGHRALLVDADLRRPSLHEILGLAAAPGLAELLAENLGVPLEGAVQATRGGLGLIAAGERVADAEAWSHERATALIEKLRGSGYDYAVVDAPALLSSATGSMLASVADDVLLVARAGATRSRELKEARHLLERHGAPLRGVVLNDHSDAPENRPANHPRAARRASGAARPAPAMTEATATSDGVASRRDWSSSVAGGSGPR